MRANVDDQDWGHFPSYCYGWQQDWVDLVRFRCGCGEMACTQWRSGGVTPTG